jgi:hypothetical protein
MMTDHGDKPSTLYFLTEAGENATGFNHGADEKVSLA